MSGGGGKVLLGKVLLVHGEPQVRSALSRLMRDEGYAPMVAATGEEALALAQGDDYRVVVTDLKMVGMGGIALLQRLSPLLPEARFLALASHGSINTELLPRGHGIRVFFKPWREDELLAAVQGADDPPISVLPPANVPEQGRLTRVLLVEDDAADALLFQEALAASNPGEFEVIVATDMASAETLLRQETFDVISLDLGLPDARGLEALARLQAEAPDIACVVVSGSGDPQLAIATFKAGAQDYLVKRADGAALAKSLRYAQERKRAEQHLAESAFHDQLTGLANRNLFRQRVAKALTNCRRKGDAFAVLLLDMDRFKSVNDGHGHDAGDAFLQEMADRLRESTRETDTVARFGGDEFAVLATGINAPNDVGPIVERILNAIRLPVQLSGTRLLPTASIGAAVYPASGEDSDTLLAAADAAMYVAKREGRNGYHIHGAELTRQIAKRLQLERELREAIERREFLLHYQPQVAHGGGFVGAEALLRWKQASGVIVPASEFIGVLEDTGLIMELGSWIVETACQQLMRWRNGGVRIDRMAINLSARQLLARDFPPLLRRAVQSSNLAPPDIELELTESSLLRDTAAMRDVLVELHEDGFRVALDDFGTGYCSVAYLEKFPIDTLKVDGSFVEGIARDSYRRNLVGGIIQLARRLGLDVVAEGVETVDQRDVLAEERCRIMQGHLFATAVAPEQFPSACA